VNRRRHSQQGTRNQTLGERWSDADQKEMEGEVSSVLRRKVAPDWTSERVDRLVDRVLERWD
jgi:hypothetical protein